MADEPMHLEPPSFPTIAGISAASNAWGDVNMHVEPATDLEARLMKVAKSCQIHELLADVNPEGEISDAGDGKTAAQQPADDARSVVSEPASVAAGSRLREAENMHAIIGHLGAAHREADQLARLLCLLHGVGGGAFGQL